MKKITAVALCAAMLTASACTTTEKVSVTQPGDRLLTCSELRDQFAQLDGITKDAQRDQGVNVANAAALVLFWPAIAGNYLSARDARQLAEDRKTHLMKYYTEKSCDNPANAEVRVRVPAALLAPIARGRP
jgi:hypothetical protein